MIFNSIEDRQNFNSESAVYPETNPLQIIRKFEVEGLFLDIENNKVKIRFNKRDWQKAAHPTAMVHPDYFNERFIEIEANLTRFPVSEKKYFERNTTYKFNMSYAKFTKYDDSISRLYFVDDFINTRILENERLYD
jgi:hypothetical protein